MWSVVDLGTKKGCAIDVFRRSGGIYFSAAATVKPKACLGIERKPEYRAEVESRGYCFTQADILSPEFVFPEAEYYLAFDFLEHLPSVSLAQLVVSGMLAKATRGVWLCMPSFREDICDNRDLLSSNGLRLSWTTWRGHTAPVTISDVKAVFAQHGISWNTVTVKPNKHIKDSYSRHVVPFDAPSEAQRYDKTMAPKPLIVFKPPLVGQWEIIYRKG